MGVWKVRSPFGPFVLSPAIADYSSCGVPVFHPVCGSSCSCSSVRIVAVGRCFCSVVQAVLLPLITRTAAGSHSAIHHGPSLWRFPVLVLALSPVWNPVLPTGPVCQAFLVLVPVPSPVQYPAPNPGPISNPFLVPDPIYHPLQLTGPVFHPVSVLGPVAYSHSFVRAVAGGFQLLFVVAAQSHSRAGSPASSQPSFLSVLIASYELRLPLDAVPVSRSTGTSYCKRSPSAAPSRTHSRSPVSEGSHSRSRSRF